MNDRKQRKTNPWLIGGLAALGVGTGVAVVSKSKSKPKSSSSSASGSSGSPANSTPSPAEIGAKLRAELLTVTDCSVAWKLGEASRTGLLAHYTDFFVPAIAEARSKGLLTTDEITGYVASLLVPGCPWPPQTIQDFDIDAAVAGQLGMIQTQMWTIAQALGSVQLYLAVRQVVAGLRVNRRG